MTSFFQLARQQTNDSHDDVDPMFQQIKEHKTKNIIPPIGIAHPDLVQSFMENMENEDAILKDIAELEAYNKETFPQTAKREVLGHGARFLEAFSGGVGGLLNLLTPEAFESEEGMPYSEAEKPQGFPSAHELREITKEKTGRYLEPKSDLSKASQDFISDVGSAFATPGIGWWQRLLAPLVGQSGKQIVKGLGGGEKAQEWTKQGLMLTSSIMHLGNGPQVARNALRQAEDMIPRGLSFNFAPSRQAINRLRNSSWFRSGRTASKGPAMDELQRIENAVQGNTIDGRMAMQLRRDINEARKQLGGFQLNQPVDRRSALYFLDEVDRALLQSMEQYGTRVNPQWWRQYQRANEAVRVTQRSQLISNFIEKHAKPLKSDLAKHIFNVGSHQIAASALALQPPLAAAAGAIGGAAKSVQLMNRMIRSPVLRNHYMQVLHQAALGNVNSFNKAMQAFDAAAQKEDKSNNSRHRHHP